MDRTEYIDFNNNDPSNNNACIWQICNQRHLPCVWYSRGRAVNATVHNPCRSWTSWGWEYHCPAAPQQAQIIL